MSAKSDKKARRRAAAMAEVARRHREAEQESPLERNQLDALHDHLANYILAHGHDGSFSITRRWLCDNQYPVDETIEFFKSRRLSDDYDIAVNGDSYKLFGPTRDRLARMPLLRDELVSLLNWLDKQLPIHGCDHTTRLVRTWLQDHSLPVAESEFAFLAQGGACDCEILLNIEPETIYP